ncbi:MAG: hypothetical protein JWN96_1777 [Mycobacterium sp.]|nr:hypothetical protein [Mycobacterium sp.]
MPLTSGSSHSVPTVAKLTDKLLTSDKVGEIAAGNFTSSPASDDDGSDDNSKTDCKDVVNAPAGVEKADAARDFDDGSGQFAEEDLSYTVGAASLFSQLKTQLAACHTLTLDGGQMALSTLPDPLVGGSDDTLAMQASGTISGIDFVFDIVAARFGNGVIELTYGSTEDAAQVSSICNQLLQASAAKAKSAF